MKKMLIAVALMLATTGNALASHGKITTGLDSLKIETIKEIVAKNDSTPHIISFYDIDKIVINNDKHVLIRIYDDQWRLIEETKKDVNLVVVPGNYYVACQTRIKSKYVVEK